MDVSDRKQPSRNQQTRFRGGRRQLAKRNQQRALLFELTRENRAGLTKFFRACLGNEVAAKQLFILLVDNFNSDLWLEQYCTESNPAAPSNNGRENIFTNANALLSVCNCNDLDADGEYDIEARKNCFNKIWRDALITKTWLKLESQNRESKLLFKAYAEWFKDPLNAKSNLEHQTQMTISDEAYALLIHSARKQFAGELIKRVRDTFMTPVAIDLKNEVDLLGLTSRLDLLPANHSRGE